MSQIYVLANFGGPRSVHEIEPFLISLLTDPDVTGKILSEKLTKKLFTWIAKKRTPKVVPQYQYIGGFSPIVDDTLSMVKQLEESLQATVIPFHRYLPSTHQETLLRLQSFKNHKIIGIPLFPHFTYCVTGSIIKFLSSHLPEIDWQWITDFGSHTSFIQAWALHLKDFFKIHDIQEKDCLLLLSVHGIPQRKSKKGDPYAYSCQQSFDKLQQYFPLSEMVLSFQSRFGPSKWLQPYTQTVCRSLTSKKKHVVIIPIGFVSDHLETLFEIEHEYLPTIRKQGYHAHRVPAIFNSPHWIPALNKIIRTTKRARTTDIFTKQKDSPHILNS